MLPEVLQDNSREFFQRLEDLEKSFITGLTEGVVEPVLCHGYHIVAASRKIFAILLGVSHWFFKMKKGGSGKRWIVHFIWEVASSTVVISSWFQVSYPIEKHTLRGKIKSDLKTRFSLGCPVALVVYFVPLILCVHLVFVVLVVMALVFCSSCLFCFSFCCCFWMFLVFSVVCSCCSSCFCCFAVLVLPPSFCSFCSCLSCLPVLLLVLFFFFFFLLLFFFSCVCLLVIVVLFPAFAMNMVAFPAQHQQIITGPTGFHILLLHPYLRRCRCQQRDRKFHAGFGVGDGRYGPTEGRSAGASAGWALEKIFGEP